MDQSVHEGRDGGASAGDEEVVIMNFVQRPRVTPFPCSPRSSRMVDQPGVGQNRLRGHVPKLDLSNTLDGPEPDFGELSPITFACEPFQPNRGVVNTLLPEVSGFPLSTQDSNAAYGRRTN